MPIHCDTQKANAFNDYFYSAFNKTFLELPPCIYHPGSLYQVTITEADVYETNLITTSDNSKIYIYIRGITKTRTIPSTMYQKSTLIYCYTQKAKAFYSVFNKTFLELPTYLYHPESLCQVVITEAEGWKHT